MIEILKTNPYRILGVYGNTTLKEIVANRGRINAFSKVGKKCTFPTDLEALLGPVDRTPETVQQADSALTIEADKLRYAQFWLMKGDETDVMAVKAASEGDIDQALALLSPHSLSGLQNRMILNLVRGNVAEATRDFSKLYDSRAQELTHAWDVKNAGATELLDNYVATVMEGGADPSQLMGAGFPASWNDAVSLIAARPYIQALEADVAECKASKEGSAVERLAAGRRLSDKAGVPVMKLRSILPATNPKLINICDKVANEVLQSAIDFYNASNDLAAARDALNLGVEAKRFAMGSMVKQRIDENLSILQDNANSAPPAEASREVEEIRNALNIFTNEQDRSMAKVSTLIDNCQAPLASIRTKLGEHAPVYVYWSTALTHVALNVTIDIVNDLQKKVNEAPAGTNLARGFYLRYAEAVTTAYFKLREIENLGMDTECRKRYDTNFTTLKALYDQIGAINAQQSAQQEESKSMSCLTQLLIYAAIIGLIQLCS